MCGIFGYVNYGHKLSSNQIQQLYSALSKTCIVRGADACGISYVDGGELVIQKKAGSIVDANFQYAHNITTLMGHCRLAVKSNYNENENNHPFLGKTLDETLYSMSHNGILSDILQLNKDYNLPQTNISTDSYVIASLLNTKEAISFEHLKFVCENLSGSYCISFLDENDNLFICRGDVPVYLVHFKQLGLYVYISTKDLFEKAISQTFLNGFYDSADVIHNKSGELFKISSQGKLSCSNFTFNSDKVIKHNWYSHEYIETPELKNQLENLNNE